MESTLSRFLKAHRETFIKTLVADELIEYLPSLKGEDIEAIETEQRNGGKIKGAKCLLDRVGRKSSLEEFLQGLQHAGYKQLLLNLVGSPQNDGTIVVPGTLQLITNMNTPIEASSDIIEKPNLSTVPMITPLNNIFHPLNNHKYAFPTVNNHFNLNAANRPQENIDITDVMRNSFLPQLAELVGRESMIGQVTQDIEQNDLSCVLVMGPPGFGKTSVAVSVAYRVMRTGRVGTFVSLRSVYTAKGVIQQLLTGLKCGLGAGHESPPGEVFQILKQQHRKRLILFDNADEMLEDVQRKDFFMSLISQITMIRDIKVIVTSRHVFKICQMKMKVFEVKELAPEDAVTVLCSKTMLDTQIAVDLTTACGMTPLALQVIASLIEENKSRPADILKELRHGKMMEILSPAYLGSDERLMSCMNASYRDLNADLRCAFVSIAVFPCSFNLSAAAAVLGLSNDDARRNVLEPLRRRSLLDYDVAKDRWSMHVLLRAFGREMRDVDPATQHIATCKTDLHRFCSYFSTFLDQAAGDFSKDTLPVLQRCEEERFNIMHALNLAGDQRFYMDLAPLTDITTGSKLSQLLSCFLPVERHIEFFKSCLNVAQKQGNLQRELSLICLLGNVYISSVNCTFTTLPDGPGEECVKRALRIVDTLQSQSSSELAQCLVIIGKLEFELLMPARSMRHLKQAMAMQERLQECPSVVAITMIEIAKVEMCGLKNYPGAAVFLRRAEESTRDLLSKLTFPKIWYLNIVLADILRMLGLLHLAQDKAEQALKLFEEAHALRIRFTPYHPDTRFITDGIARCWLLLGNHRKAIQFYEESLSLRKKVCGVEVPVNLKVISYVRLELGQIEEAIRLEGAVMNTWSHSMKSNGACLKYLTNDDTRQFVYTVFYALVQESKCQRITEWIFKLPETRRETRIREFAHAMWSSRRVTIMQLEPDRYASAVKFIRDSINDVTVGEFRASDACDNENCLENCRDGLLRHCACPENKDKCLLIVRPMPPVEIKPLELFPVKMGPVQRSKKVSKICTIL